MMPVARRAAWGLAGLIVAAAFVLVPRLPDGPDIYVHLLWTQQTMTCMSYQVPPVWLHDLNAGFGSPGIRLYSPGGPLIAGALGLVFGEAGRGIRAALVIAIAGLAFAVARRERCWVGVCGFVLAAPIVIHSFAHRGAFAELLAVPAAWWVLEVAIAGDPRPVREGLVLAALWLLHAPTMLMVAVVTAGLAFGRHARNELESWAAASMMAAGLTAWHWMPLADEMKMIGNREALVGGIFVAGRNVLSSASAHAAEQNGWLAWCAVGLLAASLAGRWWRDGWPRLIAIAACIALASPLALPVWRLNSPPGMLQFPWRLLLPAALLAAATLARGLGRGSGRLAASLALAPITLAPLPGLVSDAGLRAGMPWQEMGGAVRQAFGGSPWVVDATQNRRPSFSGLAAALAAMGERRVIVTSPESSAEVRSWTPLVRVVDIETAQPAVMTFRLLGYWFWCGELDGRPVALRSQAGATRVEVPAGRHRVVVRWAGNPWSKVGQAVAGVTLAAVLMIVGGRRRLNGKSFEEAH